MFNKEPKIWTSGLKLRVVSCKNVKTNCKKNNVFLIFYFLILVQSVTYYGLVTPREYNFWGLYFLNINELKFKKMTQGCLPQRFENTKTSGIFIFCPLDYAWVWYISLLFLISILNLSGRHARSEIMIERLIIYSKKRWLNNGIFG